jgi:hypothetical protein
MKENCTPKVADSESIQQRKKNYVNAGLLKHGFGVTTALRLKKMLKCSP